MKEHPALLHFLLQLQFMSYWSAFSMKYIFDLDYIIGIVCRKKAVTAAKKSRDLIQHIFKSTLRTLYFVINLGQGELNCTKDKGHDKRSKIAYAFHSHFAPKNYFIHYFGWDAIGEFWTSLFDKKAVLIRSCYSWFFRSSWYIVLHNWSIVLLAHKLWFRGWTSPLLLCCSLDFCQKSYMYSWLAKMRSFKKVARLLPEASIVHELNSTEQVLDYLSSTGKVAIECSTNLS